MCSMTIVRLIDGQVVSFKENWFWVVIGGSGDSLPFYFLKYLFFYFRLTFPTSHPSSVPFIFLNTKMQRMTFLTTVMMMMRLLKRNKKGLDPGRLPELTREMNFNRGYR